MKGVPKEDAEPLRQRYQAARAQIRPRLDAFFAQRAAAMAENRQKKEELAARVESLSDAEFQRFVALRKKVASVAHGTLPL